MPTYLEQLTLRLATGVSLLPEDFRAAQTRYLLAAQKGDGGFGGREGGSDLYYTGFALRSLSILGELYGPVAERAASFLESRLRGQEAIVDFLSLIYGAMLLDTSAGIDIFRNATGDWRTSVADALEALRREDGGYAKAREGTASSTYHTFLVLLCRQLIERDAPEPERIAAFVRGQAADEGGYREIRVSKRAGTNPTAAAIGSLQILDSLDDDARAATLDFLAQMQTDEGGLRANTRIPIADLLSTFTGLLTLQDLNGSRQVNLGALQRYVHGMARPEGGFHGAAWDTAHDVEYSFYGLGCMALLANEAAAAT